MYDDDWDDLNLLLPPEFITNFSIEQIDIYNQAVAEYGDPDMDIAPVGVCGERDQGSLWFHGTRRDLSAFWAILRRIEREATEVKS